ncbi:unnamed protein product [Cunninghamella blakesleeana]
MPFKNILRRKSKNRRESKVIHEVDECEVLFKPFPKLETRVTSPTELINLVGHPDITTITTTTTKNKNKNNTISTTAATRQRPALLKTSSTANTEQFHEYLIKHRTGVVPKQQHRTVTFFDNHGNNDRNENSLHNRINEYNKLNDPITDNTKLDNTPNIASNRIAQNNTNNDKTLIHQSLPSQSYTITTFSEYTDHKIYNHRLKQQSSPCLKQQYDHDQTSMEIQELRMQLKLLEKEQEFWQQRIHDHQRRENDLLNLLETTIDKLNQQLVASYSTIIDQPYTSNDHHYYHLHQHHHHYIPEPPSFVPTTNSLKKKKPLGRSKSMDHYHHHPTSIQFQNKSITNIIQHNNSITNNPIYDDYILPPWPPFLYF